MDSQDAKGDHRTVRPTSRRTSSHGFDPTETIDLMKAAKGGDQEALERFYLRCTERLRQIARRRMGPRARAEHESVDIAQQAAAVVVRKFDEFTPVHRRGLVAWLKTIVERQIRGICRRQRVPTQPFGHEDVPEPVGHEKPPCQEAIDREAVVAVHRALRELKPMQRRLLRARFFDGLSWREIASLLGKTSDDAARMARSRALFENRETVFVIDTSQNRYRAAGEDVSLEGLPDLALSLTTAASERYTTDAGGIRFYPDGSSSGGRITLDNGAEVYDIIVDWFDGHTRIARQTNDAP